MSSCCARSNTLIFACSGGSNVGQLSNEAAKRLDQEGCGSFFCLAGIGGDIAGMIGKSKEAANTIVIDGCDIGCAKAAFDRAGLKMGKYVVITDLGIEKGHHFNLEDCQVDKVCEAANE